MPDLVSAAAMAGGLSWASGLRLYMTLFIAGWFGRMDWVTLPSALEVLESPGVLAVTGTLLVIEFLADKFPGVDSGWDALQTFIRIPAGAVLSAAAISEVDPAWTMIAGLLGGTVAAGTHFTKAGGRAAINTSPEPFSNWAASFSEDVAVAGGLVAAFFYPWVLLAFLAVFMLMVIWLLPKLWRGLQRFYRKMSP
jgi:hypothetical protein